MKLALIVSALFLLVLGVSLPVRAASEYQESYFLKSGEVVNDDVFIAASEIVIEGTINGDLYAFGKSIRVEGAVNGDIYGFAEQVIINGDVEDDVLVAGSNVTLLESRIGDSVTAASQQFTTDEVSTIGGSVLVATQLGRVRAHVGRNILAAAENLVIGNIVAQNVKVAANQLEIEEGTIINGTLTYRSDSDAEIGDGTTISGGIRKVLPEKPAQESPIISFYGWIWSLLGALLTGLVLLKLFPREMNTVAVTLRRQWLKASLVGVIATFVAFPAFIVLLISVVGIPLGLLLAVAIAVLLYLAKIIAALFVGTLVAERFMSDRLPSKYLRLFMGLWIYYVIAVVPLLGGLFTFLSFVIVFGALVLIAAERLSPKKRPAKGAS